MDAAFGWIGRLFEFIGTFFPRLLIVEANRLGVAFRQGKHVICLDPGLHFYWPFWTTVETIPAVRQTQNLPTQALEDNQENCLAVGGMVRYEVTDVRKALAETHELDAAITDESLAVLCDYVTSHSMGEITTDRRQANTEITKKVRGQLEKYGVNVLRVQLTDLSRCLTLCHLGQGISPSQGDAQNDE